MIKLSRLFKPKFPIFPLVKTHKLFPALISHNYSTNSALIWLEEEITSLSLPKYDSHAYAWALQDCIQNRDYKRGKALHCHSFKGGMFLDLFSLNILLNFYVKFNALADAHKVFDEMRHRNTVSFVTLIQGYAQQYQFEKATNLFIMLNKEGYELNKHLFTTILKLFVNMELPEQAKLVHSSIYKLGHESNPFVGSVLIDAYSLCGYVYDAQKVFEEITARDIVAWTGMVSCYANNDCPKEAMQTLCNMRKLGFKPNNFTLTSGLKASISLSSLNLGKTIHCLSLKSSYQSDSYVGGALLDMYAKLGNISDARLVFESLTHNDVILWSYMIARYAQTGQNKDSLALFARMVRSNLSPNEYSLSSVLQACANMGDLLIGKQIHGHITKVGYEREIFVSNSLTDFYAKCGDIDSSLNIFSRIFNANEVSWNTMIVGYVQLGFSQEALKLFLEMRANGFLGTEVTYSIVLRACASLACSRETIQIHSLISKTIFNLDTTVNNALVDTYAKCGSIREAKKVFDLVKYLDVISYNALISGYAIHGHANNALHLFSKMKYTKPNEVTCVGILTVCTNTSLVRHGLGFFVNMSRVHGIKPCMEHYTCIVRLLGGIGRLNDALDLVRKIPTVPSAMVWRALLSSSLVHKNVSMGKFCAQKVLEIEPYDETTYILLSNIYMLAGQLADVAELRKEMRDKCVRKTPGLSWIEINGQVHSFSVMEGNHPDMRIIRAMLEWLKLKTTREGYVPDCNVVLHDLEEREKTRSLWMHCERIALAYGLVSTVAGSQIRIIKNLRFCSDCHEVFKIVSRIAQREIVVRDTNRFHHFEGGVCSCGDYW